MKLTKKLISLFVCMVMVLGLATSAFAAAHSHTITIDSKDGYVYEAYQIFKGDLDTKGVLSNIEWGSGVDKTAELLTALKAMSTEFATVNDAEDLAAALGKNPSADNIYAKAFAELLGQKNDPVVGTDVYKYLDESKAFPETSKHKIDVDHDGYYLIVNKTIPTGTDTTYSRYILEVVRDVKVSHKGTFPTVDKKIVENGNKVTLNEAAIGDTVNYELVGTLPNNLDDYDTYYYAFRDTLSKGLTYNGDAKVFINGVNVTHYFHVSNTPYDAVTGTKITIGISDILALELVEDVDPITAGNQTVGEIKGGLLDTDTKVVVTYSATLNENAIIAVEGNPNVVDLQYSNDPNNDGDGAKLPPPPDPDLPVPQIPTGETPEKKVETYTTRLSIQKTDGTGAALAGAEFHLTGEDLNLVITKGQYYKAVAPTTGDWYKLNDGTYTQVDPQDDDPSTTDVDENTKPYYATLTKDYVLETEITLASKGATPVDVKAFVDASGKLSFTGLGAGTYTLTETVTPKGFNTIDPITFTITFNTETKKFRSNNDQINVGQTLGDEYYNSLYTTVVNQAGSTLPSTGGIGTTMFYLFGGLMAMAAAILLVTKKRMGYAR